MYVILHLFQNSVWLLKLSTLLLFMFHTFKASYFVWRINITHKTYKQTALSLLAVRSHLFFFFFPSFFLLESVSYCSVTSSWCYGHTVHRLYYMYITVNPDSFSSSVPSFDISTWSSVLQHNTQTCIMLVLLACLQVVIK